MKQLGGFRSNIFIIIFQRKKLAGLVEERCVLCDASFNPLLTIMYVFRESADWLVAWRHCINCSLDINAWLSCQLLMPLYLLGEERFGESADGQVTWRYWINCSLDIKAWPSCQLLMLFTTLRSPGYFSFPLANAVMFRSRLQFRTLFYSLHWALSTSVKLNIFSLKNFEKIV